jgi:hypothetical protein
VGGFIEIPQLLHILGTMTLFLELPGKIKFHMPTVVPENMLFIASFLDKFL